MSRKRTFAVFIPIVLAMVIVDRLTKSWAVAHLRMGKADYDLGFVDLTLVHNEGAAFGMGQGSGAIFIAIAIVICACAIAWLAVRRKHGKLEVIALSLIVAGGIGNLIDRLTTGYVVDFIRFTFIDFPVFNVADICVTCGVVLFLVTVLVTDIFQSVQDTDLTDESARSSSNDADGAVR